MSRIGNKAVPVPASVQVTLRDHTVEVKGKLGTLTQAVHPVITVKKEGGQIVVTRPDDTPAVRALHGLTRALIANMVAGVSVGYTRELEIQGVGFRGEVQGSTLVLQVGFSHPVRVDAPKGIAFSVDKAGRIVTVSGADKALVGEMAARVRRVRKPEPYKGKGIRYMGEYVRHKAGKAGKIGSGAPK
ncbi:MAG: 50S ribosomal protein L6 [Chloroflexi bacterium]|nr:50S ribosomal protein L6 [Chloroflexota bacterium]